MSAVHQLITDHLDIWTAADTEKKSGRGRASGNPNSVYGIKKLRELILELAVRGKLVPQDPNDEPAIELCKRIRQKKAELITTGQIRKQKQQAPFTSNDLPFNLPSSWQWSRLDEISPMSLIDGDWIESKDQDPNGEIRLIQLADIGVGEFKSKSDRFVNERTFKRLNCTQIQTNDILIARLPAPIGRACLFPEASEPAITVVDVAILRSLGMFNEAYLVKAINSVSFRNQVESFGKGATRFRIATGNLKSLLVPVPPIEEQHRIVAKVDELMALCDQLEAQHNNAADAHEQIVSHLLSTLTQSKDAADFNANWQRIATHFDTLFTTESSIDALKQTLLQLAVMGKLVPQDPNDEPASELLKRIQAEKTRLVSEGKYKKSKTLPSIADTEKPYELPHGWKWCRLQEVTHLITDGKHGDCNNSPNSGYYFLSAKDIQDGKLQYENARQIVQSEFQEVHQRTSLESGDICMVNTGATVGKIAIAENHELTGRTTFQKSVAVIKAVHPFVNRNYLTNFLIAEAPNLLKKSGGSAINNLLLGDLKLKPFPLPPTNEQLAISLRVDELMALCDQLKSCITGAKQHQQKLADVLVENAL